MWGAGIRPSDYITPKSKGSTATTEQWADRYAVASMLCYSPAELAELDAPMAKDATLEQKAAAQGTARAQERFNAHNQARADNARQKAKSRSL
jgi:hypothetical protein